MGLEFKKIEAIKFGDIVVEPKLDVETRLRLQTTKLTTQQEIDETIDLIAKCCGDKAEGVKEFIEQNLGVVDIARIQAYLAGGKTLLDAIDKKIVEEGAEL